MSDFSLGVVVTKQLLKRMALLQTGLACVAVIVSALAAFLIAPELKAHRAETTTMASTVTQSSPIVMTGRGASGNPISSNEGKYRPVEMNTSATSETAVSFAVTMARDFCARGEANQAKTVLEYVEAKRPDSFQQMISDKALPKNCVPENTGATGIVHVVNPSTQRSPSVRQYASVDEGGSSQQGGRIVGDTLPAERALPPPMPASINKERDVQKAQAEREQQERQKRMQQNRPYPAPPQQNQPKR